jgi:CRP/FNR family transcriptional regulator, cyclic AMP receptor protein
MTEDNMLDGLPWSKRLVVQRYPLQEKCKVVERTNWANDLSAKEVETLSRYLHVCTAQAGSFIVQEGQREAYMCLIVDGRVSILKEGAGPSAKQIGSAGPGRVVGEMSLIDGEPRSASVVADEPTTLLVLTGEGFSNLSLEVPRLAVKILLKIAKLISQRLRQTSGELLEYLGG